jgi:zinc transporter 1/2/3
MYEATTAAILMAGLFMSFLVEYIGYRFVKSRAKKAAAAQSMQGTVMSVQSVRSLELISVYIMEAGVIFHSMSKLFFSTPPPRKTLHANRLPVIGLTLVVAGDSFLLTLFVVIIFHQMFEGLALGTRIAALGTGSGSSSFTLGHSHGPTTHTSPTTDTKATSENSATIARPEDSATSHTELSGDAAAPLFHVSMAKKIYLATAFALVTPVGMAIGIGVLDVFNGNDPQTIVAIGVLDAFSAGILLWVGVVEMWAADWVFGGGLTDASGLVTGLGMGGLVSGMVVMSVLGKWA